MADNRESFITSYTNNYGKLQELYCVKVSEGEFKCNVVKYDDSLMSDFVDSEIQRQRRMGYRHHRRRCNSCR